MKRKNTYGFCLIILLLASCLPLFSQVTKYPTDYFRPPVDYPMVLTGSFAELRNNHFHSGIDITTQKEEGKILYASADGYVSRIKISPYGYGKALYIDHPNGYTTVYAHLSGFCPAVAEWVKSEQYRLERFEVDLFPVKGQLPVKKGEIIGYSGNSGTSEGPHIHFEIRETASEKPVDPLLFGFPVKDYIRPVISSLVIYPEGHGSMVNGRNSPYSPDIAGWGPVYRFREKDTLTVAGQFSIGLQCYDLQNGSKNRNGICRYAVTVDSLTEFDWHAETFSFTETRYINSFIDYQSYYRKGTRIIRTRIDPNNKLGMYRITGNNGRFSAIPDSLHHVKIVVADAGRNESILRFVIKGSNPEFSEKEPVAEEPVFNCKIKNEFSGDGIKISIPETSLYEDILFKFQVFEAMPGTCSKVYQIHNPEDPLHDYAELKITVDSAFILMPGKLTLALLTPGKQPSAVRGTFEHGTITAKIREFGRYALMADTTIPVIKPLNISNGKDISLQQTIRISVSDDFSGISSYRATLNGHWILLDYDPKNSLLRYEFDDCLQEGLNRFELIIEDHCGNSNHYKADLLYRKQ